MRKLQRILALAGVVLLAAMYGSTLFFALSDRPGAEGWFKASVACTILVPVFLYANTLIYRYLKSRNGEADSREGRREMGSDQERGGK